MRDVSNQLYLDLRNPLIHELGGNKKTRVRKPGHDELNIGKWGNIPQAQNDIDYIDGLSEWEDDGPTFYETKNVAGQQCIELCNALLYWSVKRLLQDLIADTNAMADVVSCHDALAALEADS